MAKPLISGLKNKFLFATAIGIGAYGGYQFYQSSYQHSQYLRAEDARCKTNAPKIKTRTEQLSELQKFKEYDLLIIGIVLIHFDP